MSSQIFCAITLFVLETRLLASDGEKDPFNAKTDDSLRKITLWTVFCSALFVSLDSEQFEIRFKTKRLIRHWLVFGLLAWDLLLCYYIWKTFLKWTLFFVAGIQTWTTRLSSKNHPLLTLCLTSKSCCHFASFSISWSHLLSPCHLQKHLVSFTITWSHPIGITS